MCRFVFRERIHGVLCQSWFHIVTYPLTFYPVFILQIYADPFMDSHLTSFSSFVSIFGQLDGAPWWVSFRYVLISNLQWGEFRTFLAWTIIGHNTMSFSHLQLAPNGTFNYILVVRQSQYKHGWAFYHLDKSAEKRRVIQALSYLHSTAATEIVWENLNNSGYAGKGLSSTCLSMECYSTS